MKWMRLDIFCASLEDPRVVYALVRIAAEASLAGFGAGAGGPYREGAIGLPPTRRPVNMVLVIDRSSSMRGPRLLQAIAAVRKVVDRLDERDRLGVVAFDASVRVLHAPAPVTDEARRRLSAELDQLDSGAGTNLSGGWKKGCELAAAGFVRDADARVVLLTDGLPSLGVRNAEKLGAIAEAEAARGVATTTMGIGEAFDDELLGEIARRGRGGFYYLANPEAIPAAFGRELEGVFAIAAKRVEIKIVLEEQVASCEVLHRLTTRHATDGIAIEVGELALGAPRQVLIRMVRQSQESNRLLAKLVVTYTDINGREEAHLVRVVSPNTAAVPTVGGRPEIAEVTLERLRLASAVAIDEAWARRASGHREQAIAALAEVRSAVAGALDRALAPRPLLEQISAELAQAEDAIAGAAREAERYRRAARERSHVTLLGHSAIRPLPEDDLGD